MPPAKVSAAGKVGTVSLSQLRGVPQLLSAPPPSHTFAACELGKSRLTASNAPKRRGISRLVLAAIAESGDTPSRHQLLAPRGFDTICGTSGRNSFTVGHMTRRKVPFRRPSADEQTVLRQMQVKLLVRPQDIKAATKSWPSTIICTTPGWWESTCAMRWSGRGAGWRWPPGVRRVASQGPGRLYRLDRGATARAPALGREQLALVRAAAEPLPQSGQPVYEADARTVECGLAERVAPSGRVGGEFCGP